MTSNTTKIQAAGNEGTSTDLNAQETSAEPVYGFARLRETEVYHLMGLVQSALDETDHMVRMVHEKARDRWLDHQGNTEPLDKDEIGRLLSDAYQCAIKAVTVIDEAATHWLNESDLSDEPVPFR
jgi:hypothetical protein